MKNIFKIVLICFSLVSFAQAYSITVNPITEDNTINADEASNTISIAGTIEANNIVLRRDTRNLL